MIRISALEHTNNILMEVCGNTQAKSADLLTKTTWPDDLLLALDRQTENDDEDSDTTTPTLILISQAASQPA